ncbi:MAG TPA: hypothetical protein VKA90_06800, partial [Beijerinckiaceae bacterium]|nr:hypothetical protein [Beijerinckiaceae bacterium]
MKQLALALALTVVGTAGALAQDTIIRREGPYGGSRTVIQRDAGDDVVVRRRRVVPDDDVVVRRRFAPEERVVVRRRFAPEERVV